MKFAQQFAKVRPLIAIVRRRMGREPLQLLAMALLVLATWGFIELADEVLEGETHAFDRWAVQVMRQPDDPATPIGPPWVQEIGRDATALGGLGWLVFFTVTVVGYLWLDRKQNLAVFVSVATVGGLLVSLVLKQGFARPRPDIVPHLSHVSTSSFPSGHSMLSAVVYLTLGTLLAAGLTRRRLKAYVLAVAVAMTVIVGLSRIYLGVHYPTDVLAGWVAGLIWALLCGLMARWLQRRGDIEDPPIEPEPQGPNASQ